MKKKKSRIELAREIIANLRQGINRPLNDGPARSGLIAAPSFVPMNPNRSRRTTQLQSSQP